MPWPSKPGKFEKETEKLGLVHLLPFSGVIFSEIRHLATITIFLSNQCKNQCNYKTRMDPQDLQN